MDKKTRGWILVIGALVAGWLSWQSRDYAVLILAVLSLLSGYHHVSGKK